MSARGRPRKKKIIQQQPGVDHFSPSGRPGSPEEVVLNIEEYESLRLYDHLDLNQRTAASNMGISQQSFSRLIKNARKKISDAIVNAKIISIRGGDFVDRRSMELVRKMKRTRDPGNGAPGKRGSGHENER